MGSEDELFSDDEEFIEMYHSQMQELTQKVNTKGTNQNQNKYTEVESGVGSSKSRSPKQPEVKNESETLLQRAAGTNRKLKKLDIDKPNSTPSPTTATNKSHTAINSRLSQTATVEQSDSSPRKVTVPLQTSEGDNQLWYQQHQGWLAK